MKDTSINERRDADKETPGNLPLGIRLVSTLMGLGEVIIKMKWSSNGRILASHSNESIQLWDTELGECVHTLQKEEALNAAFSERDDKLSSVSVKNTINIWDMNSGKIIRSMKEQTGEIMCIAINSTGDMLACALDVNSINLWDVTSGKLIRTLKANNDITQTLEESKPKNTIIKMVFNSTDGKLASTSLSGITNLWDVNTGELIRTLEAHSKNGIDFYDITFDKNGGKLVVASDKNIKILDVNRGIIQNIDKDAGGDNYITFDPENRFLCSTEDRTVIKLYDTSTLAHIRTLEGHTGTVNSIKFAPCYSLLASRSIFKREILLWSTDTFDCVAKINFGESNNDWSIDGFAFHPHLPRLAVVTWNANDPKTSPNIIQIYELDIETLFNHLTETTVHYVNAKVMLIGDTGVGKTGLSLVLNNRSFEATDSTPGRRVWTFGSHAVKIGGKITQTRETLLWDLAGQPGYRIVHQLHLNEVAVALVVFDSRSEIDPLSGVRYWERALRLAKQRKGDLGISMKKFLVSARNDRGGVSISEDRLQAVLNDFGFDGYFKTSAKEGWQINELREAIENAIDWESLPIISSSQLFVDIKYFLLEMKKTGQLLRAMNELFNDFSRQYHRTLYEIPNFRNLFDICISRLENRDLICRLSFGDYVLLQPELLDAYASSMVNVAKDEPDGLGSIAEEIVLTGKFFVPKEQKITDFNQEQLLLYATVEELIHNDLALREYANDGCYLVFPSQFNRDFEDAPEPNSKELSITFEGPVQNLYATLVVRLGHSGLFTTVRAEMWRNAAVFNAIAGGNCGVFLQEFAEGRGRLTLFYNEQASDETRFHFEEFILAHVRLHSLDGTMEIKRFFVCSNGHPVPEDYVKILLSQGKKEFPCPCGAIVLLVDTKERIKFKREVETMENSADQQRNFETFVISAKGEMSTPSFLTWAGGPRVTLAIVFTDIIGSTAMGEQLKDEKMNEVRNSHFIKSRELIYKHQGKEIKTIGDSFMAAFKSVDIALDYARELQRNSGHPKIHIRAGIHIGSMNVKEDDVFGGTVNFAARVVGAIRGEEIWLSDHAKKDLDQLGAARHKSLNWTPHYVKMKGFTGRFTLWSLQ